MGSISPNKPTPRGGAMTKMIKIKVLVFLVAILTVTLAVSPVQACACGENWSAMSDEKIVSDINNAEDGPRIMEGERGGLPPAPEGYEYESTYKLVPTTN
jgi:hypothetical protein